MKNPNFYYSLILICTLLSCNYKDKNTKDIKGNKTFAPESYIKILDNSLHQNSGLILWNKHFWTFNDSGGKNEIYGLDFITGKILYTVQIVNAVNVDWEDIAQDQDFIYIADTGNNYGNRHHQKIYRIRKNDINSETVQTVKAQSITFQFADQVNFTHAHHHSEYDCEALFAFNDSLFVFTKDWIHFITKVYGFPAKIGSYSVLPIDSFNVKGLITGADILPNGKFALIGYMNFHPFIWMFQKTPSNFFSNPRFISLGKLLNAQTEGICFSPKGDLFISNEKTENYKSQIWKINRKKLK